MSAIFSSRDDAAPNTTKITPEDLEALRGQRGSLSTEGMTVDVEIRDARLRFGHLDVLVTPVAGSGERWFERHRVVLAG